MRASCLDKCGGRQASLGAPSRKATRPGVAVACRAAITFTAHEQVGYGDKLCVVGNEKALGRWKLDKAFELRWSEGDIWEGQVEVPDDAKIEYKLVKLKGIGDPEWEDGDNRSLDRSASARTVVLVWNSERKTRVEEGTNSKKGTAPPRQDTSSGDDYSSGSDSYSSGADFDGDGSPTGAWRGKEVQFMRENAHSRERSGRWDTSGLEGTLLQVVQGDEKSGSWLQKLDVAKGVLVDGSDNMRPGLEALAPIFIYLQWISTGSIACVEGGGHYRPNRHAELAKIMFRSLEWVAGDASKSEIERFTARRMQGKMPSFSESFTASVPLTRIRDIAHRNDIPSDLKKEIKHTLQNKLHRNAGPEDLVATEAMLQRITAPGTDYSGAFVHEFQVFTEELRDFFNAGSLTKMLDAIKPALDKSEVATMDSFFSTKGALDDKGTGASIDDVVDCMHKLTSVRALIVAGLASGLRNDAADDALIMRQRFRLADLRCEDYAFVLAARVLGLLEASEASGGLAQGGEKAWAPPVGALVLCARHLGLSGWRPSECMALDEELTNWQKLGLVTQRDDSLRLKASLQRCKRVTDGFAEALLDAYADRASKLGHALGMPDEVTNVFTEAEIRASVAFQLSRLCTTLLRATSARLGGGAYEGVVLGEARGKLLEVDCIEPGMTLAGRDPCILLVKRATGDEEITTAGDTIRGVVLCHDIPHLSHLGVRSRQERVPFATVLSEDAIANDLRPLVGEDVRLAVSASSTTLSRAEGAPAEAAPAATNGNGNGNGNGNSAASAEPVQRVANATVLPLRDAVVQTSGAKAAACGKLADLARQGAGGSKTNGARKGASFGAPAGAVLPFGCMEAAVQGAGESAAFDALLAKLETTEVGPALDAACAELQALVRDKCQPAADLVSRIQSELRDAEIVIARSSANVEDLAGLSGAGLYESVPNLEAGDPASVARGVAEVWASLFSRRAVLSRRTAGIAQADACMAVLIQEMVTPDLSFVLHTADPMTGADGKHDATSVYVELAPGLGETLASGTEGSAWRLSVSKESGAVQLYSFASFSEALLPKAGDAERRVLPGSSVYASVDVAAAAKPGMVAMQTVDYSKQQLSKNKIIRDELAGKLAAIGTVLEAEFGAPQDVEGAVKGDDIYVVQSRPQP